MVEQKRKLGDKIGSGSYGNIYLTGDGNSVIKTGGQNSKGYSDAISYPEIDSLFRIKSSYIISGKSIFGLGNDEEKLAIELERATGTFKSFFLNKKNEVTYSQIKEYILTLAFGLRCLHRSGYLHLDLSANNVMYNQSKNGRILAKIIDTGGSKYVERSENGMTLKPLYTNFIPTTIDVRPPEGFDFNYENGDFHKDPREIYKLTDKVDIWSFAILILSMFKKLAGYDFIGEEKRGHNDNYHIKLVDDFKKKYNGPFPNKNMYSELYYIKNITIMFGDKNSNFIKNSINNVEYPISQEEKDLLIDLLTNMLKIDSNERYNIENVIDHKYFESYPIGLKSNGLNFKEYVRNTYGEVCRKYTSIPMESISKTDEITRDGLYTIYNVFRTISADIKLENIRYVEPSVSCFCLAIDLYMRFILSCGPNLTEYEVNNIVILCVRMSYSIFQDIDVDLPYGIHQYFQDDKVDKTLNGSLEVKFLKSLEGKIFVHNFYDLCDTLMDVTLVVRQILTGDPEFVDSYLKLDFAKIIVENRKKFRNIQSKSKSQTFDEMSTHLQEGTFHKMLKQIITEEEKDEELNVKNEDLKRLHFEKLVQGLHSLYDLLENFEDCDARIFFMAIELYLFYFNTIESKYGDSEIMFAYISMYKAFEILYESDIKLLFPPAGDEYINLRKLNDECNVTLVKYPNVTDEKLYKAATHTSDLVHLFTDLQSIHVDEKLNLLISDLENFNYESIFLKYDKDPETSLKQISVKELIALSKNLLGH